MFALDGERACAVNHEFHFYFISNAVLIKMCPRGECTWIACVVGKRTFSTRTCCENSGNRNGRAQYSTKGVGAKRWHVKDYTRPENGTKKGFFFFIIKANGTQRDNGGVFVKKKKIIFYFPNEITGRQKKKTRTENGRNDSWPTMTCASAYVTVSATATATR